MSLLVALRKELLELSRTYRLLAVVALLVVWGLISPLLAKLTPEMMRLIPGGEAFLALIPPPTIADAVAQYVKNQSQFGVIAALILAMGAVVGEKERGAAALILSKPLSRGAFLAAKALALALAFGAGLALGGAGAYYYTALLFGAPSLGGWLALNGLMWLFFAVYIALALLGSVVARSQAMAGALAFGALIVVGGLGSVPRLGEWMPSKLLSWGSSLALHQSGAAWPALAASLALIAAALLAAWAIFRRQEL